MRILVFFDLPTLTGDDKKNYRQFRKKLIKSGFFMLQESVYCRLVLNQTAEKNVIAIIHQAKPPKGLVQVLSVTEKQFSKMEYIVGNEEKELLDTDQRIVIL